MRVVTNTTCDGRNCGHSRTDGRCMIDGVDSFAQSVNQARPVETQHRRVRFAPPRHCEIVRRGKSVRMAVHKPDLVGPGRHPSARFRAGASPGVHRLQTGAWDARSRAMRHLLPSDELGALTRRLSRIGSAIIRRSELSQVGRHRTGVAPVSSDPVE